MNYTVVFKPSADREYHRLPPHIQARVHEELVSLQRVPRPAGCKKLKARPGYRIRVGEYRVIYTVDDQARIVRILAIGHRREIYQ